MAVKLDLEKAYDRITWDFLKVVLQAVRIEDGLAEMIMFCVTSVSLPVL